MPEAEINPTGEVLVEGHHVGEMQGFRFTADRTAEGEEARAVKAAAMKALAAEFEQRAERFAAAPNGDLALASDGILRWLGAPVGTLVATDDVLKPRLVLLADEQLTGPARDKVMARGERFINFQIESQLKPLLELRAAENLTGTARGLAFQLAENFGVLNRRDVAEEVRSLDQDARAALRRLGVRFGAYHIFVPALVKPGPAGLATLLWALKNDARDKPGYGDVVAALAAGRTSIVTDPSYDRAFYRLAGFRNLGRRAVRIDILERLADLIRPTLGWKPGSGKRPDGAYGDDAFIVTPAMMSILGATAEDMEAILKGLGYRAEARPAEEVQARLAEFDAAAAPAAEADPAEAPAEEQAVAETQVEAAQPEAPAEALSAVEPAEDGTAEATPAVEEAPKPILVWRQARFERRQPQQRDRRAAAGGDKAPGKGRPRPSQSGDRNQERSKKPNAKKAEQRRPQREERPVKIDPNSPFAALAALKEQLRK